MDILNVALGILQDDALRNIAQQASGDMLDGLNSFSGVWDDDRSLCDNWIYDVFVPKSD